MLPGAAYAHLHESTGPWQALANALAQNAMVTELDLSGNQIGDVGAKARPGFWVGFRGRPLQTTGARKAGSPERVSVRAGQYVAALFAGSAELEIEI